MGPYLELKIDCCALKIAHRENRKIMNNKILKNYRITHTLAVIFDNNLTGKQTQVGCRLQW